MARIPYDWDCLQIAIINPRRLIANIHPRYVDDFSTACFVVNRRYADKLMHFHCRGDKFKLDNPTIYYENGVLSEETSWDLVVPNKILNKVKKFIKDVT